MNMKRMMWSVIMVMMLSCGDGNGEDIAQVLDVMPVWKHCLSLPYAFEGKKAIWFGNSITCGYYQEDGKLTKDPKKSYAYLFSEMVGLDSYFSAVAGTCFGYPADCCISYRVGISEGDYDYVFVAGGTNDYSLQTPLGEIGDKSSGTYYGALNVTAAMIREKYPEAKVIFITPINQCRNIYNTRIKKVIPLDTYRDAIYRIADYYSFDVVDGRAIPFPDENGSDNDRDLLISDGVHPTVYGHEVFAKALYNILRGNDAE